MTTQSPQTGEQVTEALSIGDRVFVNADACPAEWRDDWRGVEAWVTGLSYAPEMPSGLDVEISETMPPQAGDRTDGFDLSWLSRLTTAARQPKAMADQSTDALQAAFRAAFRGHGVAIRRKDDPPIPGEPFMSMADAARLAAKFAHDELTRLRAVLEEGLGHMATAERVEWQNRARTTLNENGRTPECPPSQKPRASRNVSG